MGKIKMNFKDLPKSTLEEIENGIYILEITDIIEDTTNTGGTKIVMSHDIVGTSRKINFDNYVVFDKDNKMIPFGTAKLRTLINALGIEIEEITIPVLRALALHKRFKANVELNEKGYPRIHFADIYALDDPNFEALNDEMINDNDNMEVEDGAKVFTEEEKENESETEEDQIKINDDDI